MQELEVYSMIGAEGFTRLVAAFYRQVSRKMTFWDPCIRRRISRVLSSASEIS
jgi:hypothetical protein